MRSPLQVSPSKTWTKKRQHSLTITVLPTTRFVSTPKMSTTISWNNVMESVTFAFISSGGTSGPTTTSVPAVPQSLPGIVDAATKDLVTEVVNCYLLPVVFLFGVCGNVMSFVVLVVHGLNTSTNVLLLGVTVSDFCYLVTLYARKVSCIVSHFDPAVAMTIETTLIPNVFMVNRVFTLTTPFLTMIITLERCLAVTLPLKIQSIVTPLRMKLAVIFIFIFTFCAVFPFFLCYQIRWVSDPVTNLTVPRLSGTPFFLTHFDAITVYNNMVLSALFNYLPMAVVVVCTVIVITTVKKSARWRKLTSQTGERPEEHRMTKLLMSVVAVYIVCYLPRCAVLVANSVAPNTFNSLGGRYGNLFYLISALQHLLYAVNSSVNFIIYMVMSHKFFMTYKRVFLCHKMRGKGDATNITRATSSLGASSSSQH